MEGRNQGLTFLLGEITTAGKEEHMTRLFVIALLLVAPLSHAACTCSDDLLAYECSGQSAPQFVVSDGFTLQLTALGEPANFSVDGLSAQITLGGVVIPFTIGVGRTSTRFITDTGGECIGLKSVTWPNFPAGLTVDGRGLQPS